MGSKVQPRVYGDPPLGHSYHQFYYHFAWATKHRAPMLTQEIEDLIYRYIRKRCRQLEVFVYALNGIDDHTHLVCSIPPKLAVAEIVELLKGGSAHFINHLPDRNLTLYWQRGYGAFTFAHKDLQKVVQYVDNQKEHHRSGKLWASLEQFGEPEESAPNGA